MKKLILSSGLLLVTFIAFSQNCNIGNQDSTVFDNTADPMWQNYLLGVSFELAENGTVYSLNLIGRNTGVGVQMAMYEDNAGVPGDLVVDSQPGTVGSGVVSLDVTPTFLNAGTYWLMAVYENDGGHVYNTSLDMGNPVYFQNFNFGNDMPVNASGFQTYTNSDFAYFAEIDCGGTGITDVDQFKTTIYPNPVSDLVYIHTSYKCSMIRIFNNCGQLVQNYQPNSMNPTIDMSGLSPGIYSVEFEHYGSDPVRKRIIKQ